jgi:Flp pilus assembly protein CpaB
VVVTLATTPEQAQKIVYAAEHAAIWLSLQTVDSKVSGTTTTSGKNLFR